MATRNPVSVLPEPVGDATRTSLPAAMWGHAAAWGGVGPAGKRRANQLATAGWNSVSGEASVTASGTAPFHQDVVTGATSHNRTGDRTSDRGGDGVARGGVQAAGVRPQQAT